MRVPQGLHSLPAQSPGNRKAAANPSALCAAPPRGSAVFSPLEGRSMTRILPVALFILVAASNAAATAVTHVGTFRFPVIVQGHTLNVPYDGNESITAAHSSVVRCVIEVPGSNRNSQYDYQTVSMDASTAGVNDATSLLFAPQFLTEEDITAFKIGRAHV